MSRPENSTPMQVLQAEWNKLSSTDQQQYNTLSSRTGVVPAAVNNNPQSIQHIPDCH